MAFQGQIKITYACYVQLNYFWSPGINGLVVLFQACIKCSWLISRPFGKKKKSINGSFTIFVLETVLAEGKHFHADFLFLNLNALQHQRSFRNIFITQMILFIYLFFYSFHAFKCDILPRLCMKWVRVGIREPSHTAFHLLEELLRSRSPCRGRGGFEESEGASVSLLFTQSEHSRSCECEGTRSRVSLGLRWRKNNSQVLPVPPGVFSEPVQICRLQRQRCGRGAPPAAPSFRLPRPLLLLFALPVARWRSRNGVWLPAEPNSKHLFEALRQRWEDTGYEKRRLWAWSEGYQTQLRKTEGSSRAGLFCAHEKGSSEP